MNSKKKKKEPHLGKVKSIWPEFLSYGNTSGCFLGLTNMIQQNAILAYNQKYRFTTHTRSLSLTLSFCGLNLLFSGRTSTNSNPTPGVLDRSFCTLEGVLRTFRTCGHHCYSQLLPAPTLITPPSSRATTLANS